MVRGLFEQLQRPLVFFHEAEELIGCTDHRLEFSTLLPKHSEAIDVLDDVRAGQRLVHALETLLYFAEAFEEPRIGPSGVTHGRTGPPARPTN